MKIFDQRTMAFTMESLSLRMLVEVPQALLPEEGQKGSSRK